MQLDLFCDNRRTIRLNDADDLLYALRLDEALIVYDELLLDEPNDPELQALRKQTVDWHEALVDSSANPADAERLHEFRQKLTPTTPRSLATALREWLINQLLRFPAPESIYIPPRFHIGTILLELRRYPEAERWLAQALASGIKNRGRFLAWRGDALTQLGEYDQAKDAYLAAFLEDPDDVDPASLHSPLIHPLLISLEDEDHNLDEAELPAWLPVWGWLQGEFKFRLDDIAAAPDVIDTTPREFRETKAQPVPRLWFSYLRYSEYLRNSAGKNSELKRVRLRMRELNDFMFAQYLAKIQRP